MAYGSQEGMEAIFGKKNIAKWADADNDEDEDTIEARILWALQEAEDRINDRLRPSPYKIPFEGTTPSRIVTLCNKLAGILLYETPRGLTDVDTQVSYDAMKDEINDTLNNLVRGRERIDAEQLGDNVPQVVNPD
jgi:phage gp36-like protein